MNGKGGDSVGRIKSTTQTELDDDGAEVVVSITDEQNQYDGLTSTSVGRMGYYSKDLYKDFLDDYITMVDDCDIDC